MRIPLRYSVRNLMRRKARTGLTVLGIALVVAIAVFMFAYVRGILQSARNSGAPDNVIVLSRRGVSHIFSALKVQDFNLLKSLPQIRKNVLGEPMIEPQTVQQVKINVGGMDDRPAIVRGVSPMLLQVSDSVEFIEGEPPSGGRRICVGQLAHAAIGVPAEALAVGNTISFQDAQWSIVGIFSTGGTALDSEILADISDVMGAFNRETYSTAIIKVDDPAQVESLVASLNSRNDLQVRAAGEQEYYRTLSEGYGRIVSLALALAVIAGIGGLVSGMNTMYASVLGRIREIGTLKVLGFRGCSIMASFMAESVVIAAIGGVFGCAAGMLVNGLPTKFSAGALAVCVDGFALTGGMAVSLVIGVIGALPPALRGIRMNITDALRHT